MLWQLKFDMAVEPFSRYAVKWLAESASYPAVTAGQATSGSPHSSGIGLNFAEVAGAALLGLVLLLAFGAGARLLWRWWIGYRAKRENILVQIAALQAAANPIVITDTAGTIEWANSAFTALTGYTAEEAAGRNPRDLVKSGLHESTYYKAMWDTILAGRVWQGELVNRKKDGTLYDEEQTITPVLDGSGAITHFIAVKLDVTERKRSQEALTLFHALLDQSNDAIEVIDPETGSFLDVNERACLVSGYTREELLSLRVIDVDTNVTDSSSYLLAVEELRAAGARVMESAHRRKDGSTYPVEVSLTYVHLNRPYLLAVVRDITERKTAENALHDTQAKLQRAVSAGNVGLWEWDLRTNRTFYSKEWKAQIGYQDSEIAAEYEEWRSRIHPEDLDRSLQALRAYIAGGETSLTHQYRMAHKDGSFHWILMQASKLFDGAGRPARLVGSHADITGYKNLEEQYLQAQKMESVGQLAGGVAHDFNNLLGVILGYADILLQELPDDQDWHENLRQITNAGERAAALTQQLLAFSRKQILQLEVLNLRELVEAQKGMLARIVREDINIKLVSSEDLGCVNIDPAQMEQVTMNLVVNARDAMPMGGSITIELKNVELDEAYADGHAMVEPGPYVLLAVSDTGTGMSKDTCARVFDPFYTTKERGKGTGLGLSTVYGIIKQSAGYVFVYSEEGEGTTFKIYLPRVDGKPRNCDQVELEAPPRGTGTILLVEDEESLRELVARYLTATGYTVHSAAGQEEALAVMERCGGEVRLLLTDVILPGTSGPQLGKDLGRRYPALKVLFMSGYADEAIARHGVLEQGTYFISKPFTRAALAHMVWRVLDS